MQRTVWKTLIVVIALLLSVSCNTEQSKDTKQSSVIKKNMTAKEILGNPNYLAISYGGYRSNSRDIQPTIAQLKDDMKILSAMKIKILRTYNTHLAQAANLLQAIDELKKEDPNFEMYVMLGAWINCKNAWTDQPVNHDKESEEENTAEIQRAVDMANQYPDIVKIIAVGNEAMVKWATSYYVQAKVILKWVYYLQDLKRSNQLSKDIWITSSDNFASWGGGEEVYHTEDLTKLIAAVDFVSLHTYPMHDTHYNPYFWGIEESEESFSDKEKIKAAMERARDYAKIQYRNTANYIKKLGLNKDIHIGETGWATVSNSLYGSEGSKASDEYKSGLYYQLMRDWTNEEKIACFYFEAFDETWKDAQNPGGSENHFGLFDIKGKAKYPLWKMVDQGVFKGLTRDGYSISKTFDGNQDQLFKDVLLPPSKKGILMK